MCGRFGSVPSRSRSRAGVETTRRRLQPRHNAVASALRFGSVELGLRPTNGVDRTAVNARGYSGLVGAVMRKLLHQAYGVLKHATPFNPNLEFNP